MPFFIAPYPGQTYPTRYANHHDVRAYLGFGELVQRPIAVGFGQPEQSYHTLKTKKLPLDFTTAVYNVPLTDGRLTTLFASPSESSGLPRGRKISTHRVHAECPDCGLLVPAGARWSHTSAQVQVTP